MLRAEVRLLLMPSLRAATGADASAIRRLLVASGLPVDDLDAATVTFLVLDAGDALVGAVGLQAHGDAALLRSLVVADGHRGARHGDALVAAAEARARADGIATLTLLTQTAAPFFARRGYRVIARSDAPAALQLTAEFRALCPASATCMHKTLDPNR